MRAMSLEAVNADAVEHSKTEGQAAARRAFRRTLKSLKK